MNDKQRSKRRSKAQEKMVMLRKEMWPEVSEDDFWNRNKHTGFTTIPRTMPILMNILDDLSNGKPCGQTYFSLWCRAFDEPLLIIENPIPLASESGFSGERAVSTWTQRMRKLKELGFIDSRAGSSGEFHYVLIFNPHIVVQRIRKDIQEKIYTQLLERGFDVGATDLQTMSTAEKPKPAKKAERLTSRASV